MQTVLSTSMVSISMRNIKVCKERCPQLEGVFSAICADLTNRSLQLPHAELLIANFLIEYIGYECFQQTVQVVAPGYVSCIIQINTDGDFVSDSPYLHVFDRLNEVHHQMEETALIDAMAEIDYKLTSQSTYELPNGKKLVRIDFLR